MNTAADKAKEVFLAAVELLAEDERQACLRAACADNATLRGAVDELLCCLGSLDMVVKTRWISTLVPLQTATAISNPRQRRPRRRPG